MLEPKLETFAQALAIGKTKSDAYRAMIPNTKATEENIHSIASRTAKKVKVESRVKELQQEAKDNFTISVGKKKEWLNLIVERSLQVEEVVNKDGESVGEYKFQGGDAIRAINELNKMDGDHAPTKQEHSGKIGIKHEDALDTLD